MGSHPSYGRRWGGSPPYALPGSLGLAEAFGQGCGFGAVLPEPAGQGGEADTGADLEQFVVEAFLGDAVAAEAGRPKLYRAP